MIFIEGSTVSWETQQILQGIIMAARESDRGNHQNFSILVIVWSNMFIPEEILVVLEHNLGIKGIEHLLHSKNLLLTKNNLSWVVFIGGTSSFL